MLKKTLAALATGLLLTGVLAGCSTDDKKAAPTDSTETTEINPETEILSMGLEETITAVKEAAPSLNWDSLSGVEWTDASGSRTTNLPDDSYSESTQYNFILMGEANEELVQAFADANANAEGWTIQDISAEANEDGNGKTRAFVLDNNGFQVYAGANFDNGGVTTISIIKKEPLPDVSQGAEEEG